MEKNTAHEDLPNDEPLVETDAGTQVLEGIEEALQPSDEPPHNDKTETNTGPTHEQ